MVAQSQAFRRRSLVKVVAQTCSCYRGSCRNDMLSLVPTRFETHWAHFRCSIWTYSSGRGQKFMLKQGLGPRDHTGMLSDQLRSAGHLSSSAPIASDSGRSFTGRHCSLSSATPMPAASSFAKKLCLSELPGSSLLSQPPHSIAYSLLTHCDLRGFVPLACSRNSQSFLEMWYELQRQKNATNRATG